MEIFGSPAVNRAWVVLAQFQAALWALEGDVSATREEVALIRAPVEELVTFLQRLERTLSGER
jgi:hypothetical protein